MIIVDVISQDSAQVIFTDDDQMIDTLSANRANYESVRFRGARGGIQHLPPRAPRNLTLSDQSQEALREMFLHADMGAQRDVEAFFEMTSINVSTPGVLDNERVNKELRTALSKKHR